MSDSEIVYAPASDVLAGVELQTLDDGWTVVDAMVVMRVLDADGDQRTAVRYSRHCDTISQVGMVNIAQLLVESNALDDLTKDHDDED